jgi:Mg-chelatase subunit ChlD
MQTTRLRAGLLAALLLMPLPPASAEPEAGTPEQAVDPLVPNDVLLVLDNSGSMKQNDPKFLMREVVSSFARQLPGDARLGLVLFDEKVHLVLGLRAADALDFQQKVEAALKRIDYRGKLTDIPAGVERGIYELRQQGRPEAERILIFLTDGIVDLGREARNIEQAQWLRGSLAEQAKNLGIPIFGIAFTEEADFPLIQSVVQTTGGEYYRVLAAGDIPATFEQIRRACARALAK